MSAASRHSLGWVVEPLEEDEDFFSRPMFGCVGCYLKGLLVVVLADRDEPWSGVMIPAEREHHDSIRGDFPGLEPHPILGKWLYLSQTHPDFESRVEALMERILAGDPRFGTKPQPRKK